MTVKTNIATAVSIALFTVAGSATAEVTLYDYTEASSAYEDAYVDGSFNTSDGNGFGQASYDAKLNLDYNRVFSSANRDVTIKGDVSGRTNRASTAGASSTSEFGAGLSGEVANYFRPNSKGAFWYGSGSIRAEKDAEDVASKIGLGLGYGRVVNVTPMAKAIRLVEALRQQGSLKTVPSKAVYQQIATVIAQENAYKSKHKLGQYQQYWFTDIEKAFGQGALGAGAIIKAYDVLNNGLISARLHGWKVTGGLGVVLSNLDGTDGGDPSLDFGAEYHRPISNKTQFSNVASLSTVYGDDTGYQFYNTMGLTYELSDKVDWDNKWNLSHVDTGVAGVDGKTDHALSSTLRYYLNNQLDLKVSATAAKDDGAADVDTSLNIGVGYRLR